MPGTTCPGVSGFIAVLAPPLLILVHPEDSAAEGFACGVTAAAGVAGTRLAERPVVTSKGSSWKHKQVHRGTSWADDGQDGPLICGGRGVERVQDSFSCTVGTAAMGVPGTCLGPGSSRTSPPGPGVGVEKDMT